MDSGVVTSAAEACANVATLRFNFRGVGASTGKHDDGRGEQDDVRAALAELRRRLPAGAAVALGGYSFGAAVAAAVAERTPLAGLLLVAPPLRLTSLPPPAAVTGPILIVVGAEDQYCPEAARADHFFFGSLQALKESVGGWAAAVEA